VSATAAETIAYEVTGGQGNPTSGQLAIITALSMLAGGGVAAALGQNVSTAANAAENETLNNTCGSSDPNGCGKTLGLLGTVIGGTSAFFAALAADVATDGLNIPATWAEVAEGANAGGRAGKAIGSGIDSIASQSSSNTSGGGNSAGGGSTGSGTGSTANDGTDGGTAGESAQNGSVPESSTQEPGSTTVPSIGGFKGGSQGTVDLINDVISTGTDTTEGTGTRNITQPADSSMTNDFDQLTADGTPPKPINTSFGPGEMSILPDGTRVISRPNSTTTGFPTIEIQRPDGRTVLEIRYPG